MVSDEKLIQEFQDGSREAFEQLFARYREPLFGFFRRRLQLRERAEELAQETFLAVIRAKGRYQPQASVRTYLYAIAMKLLAAEHRKSGRVIPQGSAVPKDGADAVLWVRQALDRLDAKDREILMLREYEQLSYSEIAVLLGLPINTVRSRLFRARLEMRGLLDPQGILENVRCQ
jgi:RNA polymerase sigma-70 factor, ECF subfamily